MILLSIKYIIPNGDHAYLVRFNETDISLKNIHLLADNLIEKPLDGLIDVIPAVDSITLIFDDKLNKSIDLSAMLEIRIMQLVDTHIQSRSHQIPVCYHPELAIDLTAVCQQLSMTESHLIECHSQQKYQVTMLGFLPGFAYLDGVGQRIKLPRKDTPSLQVAPGSVAVAGGQTGIYALASPGGWHVIGRTPLKMFDWHHETTPMLLRPLDWVHFLPISLDEYHKLSSSL